MELKYIPKNNGYIIDRKYDNIGTNDNIYKTKGNISLTEDIPENEEIKKKIVEFTFDSMKEKVLKDYKKRYFLKDQDISSFYFEGRIEDSKYSSDCQAAQAKGVFCTQIGFNVDFEVEFKINMRNFLIVQYDNLKLQT